MKHSIFLILLVLCSLVSKSQMDSLFAVPSVSVNSSYDLSSNAINRDFLSEFYKGSFLSDDLIQKNVANLNTRNRIGFVFNSSFEITLDTLQFMPNWNLTLGAHMNQTSGLDFQRGLFELVFQGNLDAVGENISLAPCNLSSLNYQSFDIGFKRTFKKTQLHVQANLFRGSQFNAISINEGALYTSSESDSLHLLLDGTLSSSDTTQSFWSPSGYGAGLSFDWTIPLGESSHLTIDVDDFGFIQLNNSINQRLTADSSYTGINIDNVFEPQNIDGISLDEDSFLSESTGSNLILTPARLRLVYHYQLNEQIDLGLNTQYIINTNYIPLTSVSVTKKVAERTRVSLLAGYGGFTKSRFGIGLSTVYSKWVAELNFHAMNSIFSANGLTQSATIKLKYLL